MEFIDKLIANKIVIASTLATILAVVIAAMFTFRLKRDSPDSSNPSGNSGDGAELSAEDIREKRRQRLEGNQLPPAAPALPPDEVRSTTITAAEDDLPSSREGREAPTISPPAPPSDVEIAEQANSNNIPAPVSAEKRREIYLSRFAALETVAKSESIEKATKPSPARPIDGSTKASPMKSSTTTPTKPISGADGMPAPAIEAAPTPTPVSAPVSVPASTQLAQTSSAATTLMPLTETEQRAAIFGDHNPPSTSLSSHLLAESDTVRSLGLAAGWWSTAKQLNCLDRWKDDIMSATQALLQERTPEEDLFTSNPEEELSEFIVGLLGYKLQSSKSSSLASSQKLVLGVYSAQLPPVLPDFVRAVCQLDGSDSGLARSALKSIFSCFTGYRLDSAGGYSSVQEYLGEALHRKLLTDKSLCAAIGVVLEADAKASLLPQSSPAAMERSNVLVSLFMVNTIVPFSLIASRQTSLPASASYPQLRYFDALPCFPQPTKLWCSNSAFLQSQLRMLNQHWADVQRLSQTLVTQTLEQKTLREGVLAWIARYLAHCHGHFAVFGRSSRTQDELSSPNTCSSAFASNFVYLILRLMAPFFANSAKFLPSISLEYLENNAGRTDYDRLPNVFDGSTPAAVFGTDQDGTASTSTAPENDGGIRTNLTPVTSSVGFLTEEARSRFNFATEMFWLSSRAMELVPLLHKRHDEQLNELLNKFDVAQKQYEHRNRDADSTATLTSLRQQIHTLYYGWLGSPLECPDYLSLSCAWAKYASDWITQQALLSDATTRFQRIPAGLVKAICEVWIVAARHRSPDQQAAMMFTKERATEAALFCVGLMNRPDLARSPVVLDRLLAVIEGFVRSGGGSGALQGVVLENQSIRETLAPAIMSLYTACHAVAALDVNLDTSFDKNTIRHRANMLLLSLHHYPLPEPRQSIDNYAIKRPSDFAAFISSALDTILFCRDTAVKIFQHLHQGEVDHLARLEQRKVLQASASSNATTPLLVVPALTRNQLNGVLHTAQSTFTLLNTLCEEVESVRHQVVLQPEVCSRMATSLVTCLLQTGSPQRRKQLELSAELIEDLGCDVTAFHQLPCTLLGSLLARQPPASQRALLVAMASHVDFEPSLLMQYAETKGTLIAFRKLFEEVFATELAQAALLTASLEANAASANSAASSGAIPSQVVPPMAAEDSDLVAACETQWLADEEDADDIFTAFHLVNDKVAAIDGGFSETGHYFRRLHASGAPAAGGGRNYLRLIMRDYEATNIMLPDCVRDASVALRYDEERPSYCRALLTGPADTPYFGGVFLFDIYFPPDYPNVPPLVQFLNTAGGTTRLHTHLYADGKVCVSLLGNTEGDGSERWIAKQSCLGQVLVSIQSLILGDLQYAPRLRGGIRHIPRLNEEYFEYRIATIRCTMIDVLERTTQLCPEFATYVVAHFIANRSRILQSLQDDLALLQMATLTVDPASQSMDPIPWIVKLRREMLQLIRLLQSLEA